MNEYGLDLYEEKLNEVFDTNSITSDLIRDGVPYVINEWWIKKQKLRQLFRNHEYWDEEKQAIIFKNNFVRECNIDDFRKHIIELSKLFFNYYKEQYHILRKIINFTGIALLHIEKPIVDKYLKQRFEAIGLQAPVGKKVTKVINAFFKTILPNDPEIEHSYNKIYAMVADDLSPLNIYKYTILSIHPNDYITMSNGNNWSSCHYFGGIHFSGTVSYMLDDSSFVFYTLGKDEDITNPWECKKQTRTMFHYYDGLLVQDRVYPLQQNGYNGEENKNSMRDDYRFIAQDIIAKCLDLGNFWHVYSKQDYMQYCKQGYGATAYPDFTISSYRTITRIKNYIKEDVKRDYVEIGAKPICIECGSPHDINESVSCCNTESIQCAICGALIDEDYAIYVDEYGYCCEECTFYCEYHEEYEVGESYWYIGYGGYDQLGCDYYIDNYCVNINDRYYSLEYLESSRNSEFVLCDDCCEWVPIDEAFYVDEESCYYCEDCFSRSEYGICINCGDIYSISDMTIDDDEYYCEYCFNVLGLAGDQEEDQEEEEEEYAISA